MVADAQSPFEKISSISAYTRCPNIPGSPSEMLKNLGLWNGEIRIREFIRFEDNVFIVFSMAFASACTFGQLNLMSFSRQ